MVDVKVRMLYFLCLTRPGMGNKVTHSTMSSWGSDRELMDYLRWSIYRNRHTMEEYIGAALENLLQEG